MILDIKYVWILFILMSTLVKKSHMFVIYDFLDRLNYIWIVFRFFTFLAVIIGVLIKIKFKFLWEVVFQRNYLQPYKISPWKVHVLYLLSIIISINYFNKIYTNKYKNVLSPTKKIYFYNLQVHCEHLKLYNF